MMRTTIFLLTFFLPVLIWAQAETDYKKYFTQEELQQLEMMEDTLGVLGYMIVNDSIPEHRFAACKEFILNLTKTLKIKNSFHYPFKQLKTISILSPPDKRFRIFSWQLYADKDTYHYYGAIQKNAAELELFPLVDRSHTVEDLEYEVVSNTQWYGALYYNIRQFDGPGGRHYLLFGFDGHSFFTKRKVVEVLRFAENKPKFGAPVFANVTDGRPPVTKNRLLLEYSAEASVKLNYDEFKEMIIFDHLIAAGGSIPGQGTANYPDGSYEGYRLQDGMWVYVEKVFHQVSEVVPREQAILDKQKNKDIFGHK